MAPTAIESLNAKIAVGGSGSSSRVPAATAPGSISKLRLHLEKPGRAVIPPLASAARSVLRRSSVATHPAGPVIAAIRRCPSLQQVLHCLIGPRPVRSRNARDSPVEPQQRVDDDEGGRVAQEPYEFVARLLSQDDQRPVGGAVDQAVEQRGFPRMLVLGVGQSTSPISCSYTASATPDMIVEK